MSTVRPRHISGKNCPKPERIFEGYLGGVLRTCPSIKIIPWGKDSQSNNWVNIEGHNEQHMARGYIALCVSKTALCSSANKHTQ